jgi:hypothetical protein
MGELINIDAFKGQRPAAAFATLDATEDNLADGIGSSYGIIGYRGKVWTLRLRGETHQFNRADDGTPMNYLDVIVLQQPKHKSRSFYQKGDWDESGSAGKRPICSSLNYTHPDPDVMEKQADVCALCPRNIWSTDSNGRKSKECSDYKRLAVLIAPNLTTPFFGKPLMEPVFLRIPAASLNDLAIMGEAMAGQNWHYSSYVTRVSFAPTAHPKFIYKPIVALKDAEAEVVMGLRNHPNCQRIIGDEQGGEMRTVTTLPPPSDDTPSLGFVQPDKPTLPAPEPVTIEAKVVEDAEVTEADDDLTARVAALLNTKK